MDTAETVGDLAAATAATAVPVDDQVASEAAARRAFSTSILVSATRCLLTYLVLPFVAPVLGIAADVGPGLGITIGLVAVASNVLTIRRFHAANHRWRWGYTAIAVCVIVLLGVLMAEDIASLVNLRVIRAHSSVMRRWAWFVLGWVAVAVGAIGVVVPGVPTTGPFVLAAACFARSSPRFERWVLGLPTIGRLVRDHRDGLGMPRRAKVLAIGMMLLACSLSAVTLGSASPAVAAAVVLAGLVGTWYVGWRVPTRERVLAERAVPAGGAEPADHPGGPAATAPATTATAGADAPARPRPHPHTAPAPAPPGLLRGADEPAGP